MKTKKQVLEEYRDHRTLINAVIKRIGMDSVQDVMDHGADAGFCGFTYYTDTHAFAMTHRKAISNMLHEQADSFGVEVVEMVKGFGVFRLGPMDGEDRRELYAYLGGGRCEESNITNLMAWFALEEVCRMFDE